MVLFDLPLDELKRYAPPRNEPDDFDAFWADQLSSPPPDAPRTTPITTRMRSLDVRDMEFYGYNGERIRAWYLRPSSVPVSVQLPCVLEYTGMGGGRGLPQEHLRWTGAGYAHVVVDMRGQGEWRRGDTPDGPYLAPGGPSGFITRGLPDARSYYYTRLTVDAVRAVDAVRELPGIDTDRIAAVGTSQGGGIALAVAGLAQVAAVVADVPFLCHFARGIEITDSRGYGDVADYLRVFRHSEEAVLRTLSYVDGMNHGFRASAPALFSVGLHDEVCPPSTVFAAYNHYAGPKQMQVWPFNRHESGELDQFVAAVAFLDGVFGEDG